MNQIAYRKFSSSLTQDTFPLAETQRGMWQLHQVAPNAPVYHVSIRLTIQSTLDFTTLQTICQTLLDQHPQLRARFFAEEDAVWQTILPHEAIHISHFDFAGRSEQEIEVKIMEEVERPFALSTDPPFRATLFSSPTQHELLFVFHHIAIDGWSAWTLLEQFRALFIAHSQGQPLTLPPSRATYEEFVAEQRAYLENEAVEARQFWQKQLAGELPTLQLLNRKRPLNPAHHTQRHTFTISAVLHQKLARLAKQQQTTLFTLLHTAYAVLLHRHSQQTDLLIATPVIGRQSAKFIRTVGYFVNLLPLRVQLRPQQTFLDLLQQQHPQIVEALVHQRFPLSQMSARQANLFQTMLMFQQPPRRMRPLVKQLRAPETDVPLPFGKLDVVALDFDQAQGMLDLVVELIEIEGGLHGSVRYRHDLFDEGYIGCLVENFVTLLESIVDQPHLPISQLSLLSTVERQQLLTQFTQTAHGELEARNDTIPSLFSRQAAKTAASPALKMGNTTITFAQLEQQSNQLAHHLRLRGLQVGDVVAVCLPRSPQAIIALLAVMKAGGTILPLDPAYPAHRLALMVGDAQPQLLLTDAQAPPQLVEPSSASIILLDELAPLLTNAPTTPPAINVPAQLPAVLIYTSGSTGQPKGVPNSHRALLNRFRWMWREFPFADDERCAQKTALTFVDSLWEIFGPLLKGVPLVILPDALLQETAAFLSALQNEKISRLVLVPSLLRLLLDAPQPLGELLPALTAWTVSGEALPAVLARRFFQQHPTATLLNLYGSSEVAADVTYEIVQPPADDTPLPIGRPLANCLAYVLDEHLAPVPAGLVGDLYIGGLHLSQGYHNQPALTADRFIPNPFVADLPSGWDANPPTRLYKTGDRAQWLPNGRLQFLGRADRQIKVRGVRVELGEIEVALSQIDEIGQAAVSFEAETKQLIAYLIPQRPDQALDVGQIRRALAQRLPAPMLPDAYRQLVALPLTPNGKIDRLRLSVIESVLLQGEETAVAPRNPVETALADIWRDLLGQPAPSVHADFFAHGGHSLLATQLLTRLRHTFGVSLDFFALFDQPTIAGLAALIQQAQPVSLPPVQRMDRRQPLPLAFSQERMWFLQLLQPDSTAYSVPSAVRLRGALSVARLENSLTQLVAQHEILRTQIRQQQGQPVQHILPPAPLKLPLVDLRHLPAEERETAALEQLTVDTKRPFNLQSDSLLRVILFRLTDEEHIFYINMHHIIADAWSSALMLRQLAAIYNDDGGDAPAGCLHGNGHHSDIQYADYAAWQRQWFRDSHLDEQLAYWRQKLAGVPTLDLPTDHPRPALQTYRGGKLWQSPHEATFAALQQLGQQEGATLFMTLLAAFKTLLHRLSGQSDIAVGIPIANRHHLAAERLLGTLVNTVVHRSEHVAGLTFRQLLRQVRRTALEAYAHQDMPFAKLVEALQPERNPSHSPLFQVMFNYINVPLNADMADELKWSMVPFDMQTAQFDLTLTVIYAPEVKQIVLEYNSALFERETVERLLGMYQHLLESIVALPDANLSRLPLLPPKMQAKLRAFNESTAVFPTDETIHALFEAQAAKTPNQPALRFGEAQMSFAALNAQANQLARWLRAQGAGTGDVVGICLPRSPEAVIGMLATLKVGAAYLPLDPSYPTERLNLMQRDTQARFFLTQRGEIGRFPNHDQLTLFCFGEDDHLLADQPAANLNLPVSPDSPAYLIYTSGSTGAPKGVVGPHRAMLNRFHWMWREFPFETDEVCVQKTALNFVDSIWELFGPLLRGIPVVIVPDEVLKETAVFINLLARERVSRIVMVPSLLRLLLDLYPDLKQTLPDLRLWTLSGEALPYDLVHRFRQQHPEATLLNLYGSSEVAADVTYELIGDEAAGENVPIGRPIANVQVHLLDANLQPVPLGVPGEVYVGGANVADGYWQRPALTAARFVPDPFSAQPGARLYRMGDLGKWLPDGRLLFLGRGDQQVKIRGFRIELGEVEKGLLALPSVREAVVLARPNPLGEQSLVAYVVRHLPDTTANQLRADLRQTLPDYMLPSQIVFLAALPLLPNKKVNRRALPDPEQQPAARSQPLAPATTLREKQLLPIWQRLLGQEAIGIDDDFFALGGHSLLVVRLLNEIERETAVYLPLATFFKATTIRTLAEAIEAQQGEVNWSSLVEIQAGDPDKLPFFCVHGITGDVFWFGQLAQHMDKSQPFYGLQSRGLDGVQTPLTSVEGMAAHYIREMKRVQPQGPYCLGGYSFGANVAFEMARQLEAAGEEVALLAIIDQPPTKSDYYRVRWNGRLLWHILKALPYRLQGLCALDRRERRRRAARGWRLFQQWWQRRKTMGSDKKTRSLAQFATDLLDHAHELPDHVQQLIGINYTAAMTYQPQPFAGKVTLLRAAGGKLFTSHDPEMGWGDLATQVEVEVLPASHLHLFREPQVRVLAQCLQKQLG